MSDPMEIQRTATRVAGEYLNAIRAFYAEFDSDGRGYTILNNYVKPGFSAREGWFPADAFPAIIEGFVNGETLAVEDVREARG
ncbi:hypothetical protein ACQ86N_21715 [Puia sp. P3]|uniref:hypothetical protein n=1 Tax=Puia sp. P3 TaxID=3423952 RepID=UPI003D66AAAB